ncbi:MAG: DEAD/DEAH box helicase [Pyrobaculum sp.]
MRRDLPTAELLRRLGLNYNIIEEEGSLPERSGKKFVDVAPSLCKRAKVSFCDWELYKHQLEAIEYLKKGHSVVVKASTGGGKTEIWAAYLLEELERKRVRALLLYPTKALTGDQLQRLEKYFNEAGRLGWVVRCDGDTREECKDIRRARVVATNPEMLLVALTNNTHDLASFVKKLDLIVVDELDFYGGAKATVLLWLITHVIKARQYVILGATLSNIEAITHFIKDIKEIGGKSPRPPNYIYIVMGRQGGGHRDEKSILDDNNSAVVGIVEGLKGLKGSTVVFTSSIDSAEEVRRRTGVLVHHSRVPRNLRGRIEEGLRNGKIKVVATVRTLLHGIDIGEIVRVVHLGLPPSVSEWIQREGRKGRRAVEFTESIVIPISKHDLVIVKEDFERLKQWRLLEPEVLPIDPENDFLKIYAHVLNVRKLAPEEMAELNLEKIPTKVGFYQIIRKYQIEIYQNGDMCRVEDKVGIHDFVKYYQTGALEWYEVPSVAIVDIVAKYSKKKKRRLRRPAVFKLPISKLIEIRERWRRGELREEERVTCEGRSWRVPKFLLDALEMYEEICKDWGQEPDIEEDVARGKLWSKIYTSVYFEGGGGFRLVREKPKRVVWILESRKKIERDVDGRIERFYLRKVIPLKYKPPRFYAEYLTYVYLSEVDRGVSPEALDRGSALVKAILRLKYGVDINLIRHYLEDVGVLKIWEAEPVGILKRLRRGESIKLREELNCEKLLKDIDEFWDEKLGLLMEYIDPSNFTQEKLIDVGFINEVRKDARKFAMYLCNMAEVKIGEEWKKVPKVPARPIAIVDRFDDYVAVVTVMGENFDVKIMGTSREKTERPPLLDIYILEMSRKIKEVVHYGQNIPSSLGAVKIIDLASEVAKILGAAPPLSKIREELLGDDSLINEMNTYTYYKAFASRRADGVDMVEETVKKIFLLRAKTIALLYNLVNERRRDGGS